MWSVKALPRQGEYISLSESFMLPHQSRSFFIFTQSLTNLCHTGKQCRSSVSRILCIHMNKGNQVQAFRFMVGPGHCPMISKYGPTLSKAVGQVDPSFLVVKKSHFDKNIHLIASLQTPQNRKCMKIFNIVKPVLSSH